MTPGADVTTLLWPVGVLAGVLGLVIGSFLNVVVARVPAKISLTRESRCPACDTPVRWWQNVPVFGWLALRGRCASCGERISLRYPLVEAATGVLFAATAIIWSLQTAPVLSTATLGTEGSLWPLVAQVAILLAFLWFLAAGIALTLIDLATHLLPRSIIRVSLGVVAPLLAVAAAAGGDWWALARAGIGMVALYAFYYVVRLIRPDGMGGGDVRLAALIGLILGWVGWPALIVGAFAAFVFGGVLGLVLMAIRVAKRRTAIPFGPWMVLGAWFGVLFGADIGRWYGGLLGAI